MSTEQTLPWRRSSFCATSTCVEVTPMDGMVAIRDSKLSKSPRLVYTTAEWTAFVAGVKAGEFDDLSVPTH